jgi:hypothetical protein
MPLMIKKSPKCVHFDHGSNESCTFYYHVGPNAKKIYFFTIHWVVFNLNIIYLSKLPFHVGQPYNSTFAFLLFPY